MHDKKSIYSLNKRDPDAIVYTDADKHTIRLTREDFDTEADFLKWKAWSDADYHAEERVITSMQITRFPWTVLPIEALPPIARKSRLKRKSSRWRRIASPAKW